MEKIIITQSILWAAAIIGSALVAPGQSSWELLAPLAAIAIAIAIMSLRHGINAIKNEKML